MLPCAQLDIQAEERFLYTLEAVGREISFSCCAAEPDNQSITCNDGIRVGSSITHSITGMGVDWIE